MGVITSLLKENASIIIRTLQPFQRQHFKSVSNLQLLDDPVVFLFFNLFALMFLSGPRVCNKVYLFIYYMFIQVWIKQV